MLLMLYAKKDVILLKKSVLINLGLFVTETHNVLSGSDAAVLTEVYHQKALQITTMQERQKLIEELAAKQD